MTEAEGEGTFDGQVDPVDEQAPVGELRERPEPVLAEDQEAVDDQDVADEPVAEEAPAADPTMPAPPETGEPRVDEAVGPLRDLGGQQTEEHVSAYDRAHSGLQDVLADLDRDTDGPR